MTSNKTAGQTPVFKYFIVAVGSHKTKSILQYQNGGFGSSLCHISNKHISTSVLHKSLSVSPGIWKFTGKPLTRHTQVSTVAF